MKGVIARIAPNANLIDITHGIPPGSVRAGAFALASSYNFFPKGSIHVAVVDPGVGTARRAIGIETSNYFFVAPDNGLLSWALDKKNVKAIHSLENPRYFLPQLSATFHGRDVFAPVAAHLSKGVPLHKMGPRLNQFKRLRWPEPRKTRHGVCGEIVYIDHFGNAISNIPSRSLNPLSARVQVFLSRKAVCRVAAAYQTVPPGTPVAVVGSSGFLELAINGGSAADVFKLREGLTLELRDSIK